VKVMIKFSRFMFIALITNPLDIYQHKQVQDDNEKSTTTLKG